MDNKEMEMSLDEAIEHLNDTLNSTDRMWSCDSCRREHEQLRNWLIELREMKNKYYIPVYKNGEFVSREAKALVEDKNEYYASAKIILNHLEVHNKAESPLSIDVTTALMTAVNCLLEKGGAEIKEKEESQ